MKNINLSTSKDKGRAHYRFRNDELDLSYCYIRKNACSAFKNFFKGQTDATIRSRYNSSLHLMDCLYRAGKTSSSEAKNRVVVLRNPDDRFFSAIKNKLIQQKGHSDLFLDFLRKTGKDLNEVTIDEFLRIYLLRYPLNTLDPHFYTQYSHLHGFDYNCVIDIKNLYNDIIKIIPKGIANLYFRDKANSTDDTCREEYSSATHFRDAPIGMIHNEYLKTGEMPLNNQLVSPEGR